MSFIQAIKCCLGYHKFIKTPEQYQALNSGYWQTTYKCAHCGKLKIV